MPTFVVERNVSGAARLSAEELRQIAARSNATVAGLGVPYKWITTYVAGDKLYCVHEAASADVVMRHAREGGFPADKITEVAAIIGPSTAMDTDTAETARGATGPDGSPTRRLSRSEG